MKVVVIGGTGLIGSKLVSRLREQGHEAVPASPDTGVNTLTGEGLADALAGASVVVDVSNSPSFDDAAVLEFFETSTGNLLAAEAAAGAGQFAPVLFQPIAGDDVARAVARITAGAPLNRVAEVAGPEQFRMDEFFRDALASRNDPRTVVSDPHASYYGAELGERTLLPSAGAILADTRYGSWPGRTAPGK